MAQCAAQVAHALFDLTSGVVQWRMLTFLCCYACLIVVAMPVQNI
jgi:uncharacterized membrane protein